MEKIRWGIMGAGRISGWFSKALAVLDDAEKYAVASRTLAKGEAFAKEYHYEKAYGSYEELLSDPLVDVVYIGTPIGQHYEHIKMCLHAGKNVLCEKSLTENAQQAEEVVKLAREKKLFLMEAMWTKCQPTYRQMKAWIEQGLLGEVKAADIRFYTKAGRGHRLYNKELAGGALLDLGYYPVTYACDLLGYHPAQVIDHVVVGASEVDYLDSIVLEYEKDRFAHLSCGLGAEKAATVYVLGEKGRISIQDEFFFEAKNMKVYDFNNDVIASFQSSFLANGYEYEAIEVMDCIRAGKTESDIVKLDDSVAVLRILDKCKR